MNEGREEIFQTHYIKKDNAVQRVRTLFKSGEPFSKIINSILEEQLISPNLNGRFKHNNKSEPLSVALISVCIGIFISECFGLPHTVLNLVNAIMNTFNKGDFENMKLYEQSLSEEIMRNKNEWDN